MSLVVPFKEIFQNEVGLLSKHLTWERIELAEFCDVLNGFAFKSTLFNKIEGFPLIRIRDISRSSTETFYKGEFPKEYVVDNGDLLVGMDGNFGCYEWKGGEALLNQRVCKLISNENILSRKFLLFSINGYLKAIQDATSSVTVGHLSSRDIQKIPLPFPPLNEQKRIVEKLEKLLSKVDAVQARLDKIPAILKRFRQAVLAAACSGKLTADWRLENQKLESANEIIENLKNQRLTSAKNLNEKEKISAIYDFVEEADSKDLPDSWCFAALNKICDSFNYGTSTKSDKKGLVAVLRMGNIQNGKIDWTDLVYTSDKSEIEKYKLKPNSVLFNRTNSPELVGKTAIYRGEQEAIFAGYLIRINNFDCLDSEYLNYCLNTNYAKEFYLQVKSDGVSQSNINAQKLGLFELPFPPLEEQKEIVRRVEDLFKFADQIEARYKKARSYTDKLTQSILAKAFRGELVPQDDADEPASLLLERIKAEKAGNGSDKNQKPKKKAANQSNLFE